MSDALTAEQANAIYDVLVEHAGANPEYREAFVHHQGVGCREYRFQGRLGFGGKFYVERRRWEVDCYPEHLTPDRRAIIAETNAVLAGLRASYVAEEEALR